MIVLRAAVLDGDVGDFRDVLWAWNALRKVVCCRVEEMQEKRILV